MECSDHEIRWLSNQGAEMIRALGVNQGRTVIDFGCGKGRYSIPIAQVIGSGGMVLAVERDADDVSELRKRTAEFGVQNFITILHSEDIRLLSVADGTVDCVFAFDVLQYIGDAKTFFQSIRRVLKPGGTLHVYPALIPHPGAVDMEQILSRIREAGLMECGSAIYRMMHSADLLDDRVYTFCLPVLQSGTN